MLPGLNNVPSESPTLKEKRSVWRRFASLARLASTASAADGAGMLGRGAQIVASVAALRGLLKTVASKHAITTGYYAQGDGGGGTYYYDAADTTTADNGVTVIVATDGGRWKLLHSGVIQAQQAGAKFDDATNVAAAIQAAIDATSGPITIALPGTGVGRFTSTIYLRRSSVCIAGTGSSQLRFVSAAGGIAFAGDTNTYNSTAQYTDCALTGFELLSSGSAANDASIVVDLTPFSYSLFDIKAQTRRASGVIYYGQGNAGTAPYFNRIKSTGGLFGGTDYTQTAFQFRGGALAGGSNGPNANIIGPISRASSLDVIADVRVGQGNLFFEIVGETIGGVYYLLGGNASVSTGTSTGSNTSNTLNDTGKTWTVNAYINGAVQVTAGTGQGQVRTIKVNTATQLQLQEPWAVIPDNTSQYSVFEGKALKNKFVNLRGEGLDSLNPDFIYLHPGADRNEFISASVESLGSGRQVVDFSGSANNCAYGVNQILLEHVFSAPGASANVNAWPRSGLFGGKRLCGDFVFEWMKAEIDGASHGGTATVTFDIGGSAVSGGSQTIQLSIPNGESQATALPLGSEKLPHTGTDESVFLNLQTDGSFTAGKSVSVVVCLSRVV